MREWRVQMSGYGISQEAYNELKAFCRQYPEKKETASSCIMPAAAERTGSGGGGMPGDPVHRAAAKRERYLRDTEMIERAARETGGGRWEKALMLNTCYKVRYEHIAPEILPTSSRNAFFAARREFFWRLYNLRFDTQGAVET